jgi:hypothetical protein
MIENKEMQEAIDRIARTPDGLLLYRLLQKVLCGTVAVQHDHCALQFHEGRRTLARDLMAFMSEGIAENDRAAVTFAIAKPERTDQRTRRGAGPRIGPQHFVPGYDIDRTGTRYDSTTGSAGSTDTGSNGTGSGTAS